MGSILVWFYILRHFITRKSYKCVYNRKFHAYNDYADCCVCYTVNIFHSFFEKKDTYFLEWFFGKEKKCQSLL